jgi:glycosyltransferase involved in cell wall biosynthesis
LKRVTHVAPLYSHAGTSGGSYSVAFNLAEALAARGNSINLVSHSAGMGFRSIEHSHFREIVCDSHLLLRRLNPSSYIPTFGLSSIIRAIRDSDVLHVHLARDIFPIFCSLLGLCLKKNLVLQCHGMITRDTRLFLRLVDRVVLKYIFNRANEVLVLTDAEKSRIPFDVKNAVVFRNGIRVPEIDFVLQEKIIEIIFLGRFNQVKRPDMFINLISKYNTLYSDTLISKLFGPEGGMLNLAMRSLDSLGDNKLKYGGALEKEVISLVLNQSKVLFVTSAYENFPMVVVESLASGTPVLVFSHFDIAAELIAEFPEMVIDEERVDVIPQRLHWLAQKSVDPIYRSRIFEFARARFDIMQLCDFLESEVY